jgi:hypothetical protein
VPPRRRDPLLVADSSCLAPAEVATKRSRPHAVPLRGRSDVPSRRKRRLVSTEKVAGNVSDPEKRQCRSVAERDHRAAIGRGGGREQSVDRGGGRAG